MIFQIFSPKNLAKKLVFFSLNKGGCLDELRSWFISGMLTASNWIDWMESFKGGSHKLSIRVDERTDPLYTLHIIRNVSNCCIWVTIVCVWHKNRFGFWPRHFFSVAHQCPPLERKVPPKTFNGTTSRRQKLSSAQRRVDKNFHRHNVASIWAKVGSASFSFRR
jgi:hypothetical protein